MVEFRSVAIISSANLLCGFLVIALIGHSLLRLLGGGWFQRFRPTPLIVAFTAGQIGFTSLYYLRSMLSHVSRKISGVSLPITPLELWSVTLTLSVITFIAAYKEPPSDSNQKGWRSCIPVMIETFVVWLVLLGISLMELPRDIMLSSDPDLHAFWAQQVARVGEVPWSQGLWGPDRFSYPTGFAVLNYIWTVFTGLPVQEIVTAQPLIQTQLALALLAWTACYLIKSRETTTVFGSYVFIFSLLMAVYYIFLPFGYQHSHLHLEGTGRLSATLLTATCLCSALIFIRTLWTEGLSVSDAARYMFFTGCVATFLALINPSTVMLPSCFVACSALVYVALGSPRRIPLRSLAFLGFVVPVVELLFGDPYYFDIINGGSEVASSRNAAVPSAVKLTESLAANTRSFVTDPLTAVSHFFTLDLLSTEAAWRAFTVAAAALALSWLWSFVKSKRVEVADLLLVLLIAFGWVIYSLLLLPTALSLSEHPRGYLLYPYLIQSLQQNMFILLAFMAALSLARVCSLSRWWVSVIVVLALLSPMYEMSTSSAMVTVKPRYGYSGSMGDFTEDDKRVIDYIEEFSRKTLVKYPNLNAQSVPKILIPNDAIILNKERWLFSFGASRVLPLRETLPVAFFYSQGDATLFSWEAYKKYVCHGLNRGWMATKNIRYVFIPSQIAGTCAVGLRRQVRPEDIIFQSGDAIFANIL